MPTETRAAWTEALSVNRPGGVHALREVDLVLERGTITALAGANGSGKSTLIGVLAGTVASSEGSAFVLGLPRHERSGERAERSLRARIAYVTQDVALDPESGVHATLALFAALHGIRGQAARERIARAAALLDLDTLLDRPIARLSGGERRRMHLACALLHDSELMLLDEPTAGLDTRSSTSFWTELRQRARHGATVLVATHELEVAERSADEIVILDAGRVLERGPPLALVARHAQSHLVATLREQDFEPMKLDAFLTGFPDVRSHAIDGQSLTLEVADARASAPRLLALLAQHGLDLERLELREPSLASVYRTLTGKDLAAPSERGARRRTKEGG